MTFHVEAVSRLWIHELLFNALLSNIKARQQQQQRQDVSSRPGISRVRSSLVMQDSCC